MAMAVLRILRRGIGGALGQRLFVTEPSHRCRRCVSVPLPSRGFSSSTVPPSSAKATNEAADDERIISALVVNRPGTLAQIADVFGYADQNITGLCVRSTVVPELSRVTITCRMREQELVGLQKRLRALVSVTFFHITSMASCVQNNEFLLRSQVLIRIMRDDVKHDQLMALLERYTAEIVFGQDSSVIPEEGLSMPDTEDINYDKAVKSEMQQRQHTHNDDGYGEIFLHLAHDPAEINAFVAELRELGFTILELQNCGPLFLDTSQSTLDTESSTSFTREVATEVEKLVTIPEIFAYQLPQNIKDTDNLDESAHNYEAEIMDADYLQQIPLMSTFKLHTNEQGYFSNERLGLHARIAHQLYEMAPQDISVPRFVLLIGIPGAGKSTILGHLELIGQLQLGDFVNFDVDDVIALLPEFYHAMLNIGLGNESTTKRNNIPGPQVRYQMCRDEARFILKKNLYSAIMSRKNIILHGSGKSFTSYTNIIDQVKSAGFDTHVVCLDIPVEVAYERVEKRSNGYGRNVPHSLVDFTSSLITRNFRRLATRVPNAHLFDSNEIPPRLVWSKQRSEVVVEDPDDPVQQRYQL
uniref:ACT domain-containing protein n=1 Tax=Globisporangium ultimum (strain ATCC 200006 / CBS 805.95 / DAOM BR144) TaxID=431595 RepID=K3X5H8_GLOUD